jgi:hypothetical protein
VYCWLLATRCTAGCWHQVYCWLLAPGVLLAAGHQVYCRLLAPAAVLPRADSGSRLHGLIRGILMFDLKHQYTPGLMYQMLAAQPACLLQATRRYQPGCCSSSSRRSSSA